MARVTVEDCIDKVPNRFELVLLAGHRARMVSQGAPITVDRDNDKNPVVALREIADETIVVDDLREEVIHSMQMHVEVDEPEPTEVPLIQQSGDMVMVNDQAEGADLPEMEQMTEEERKQVKNLRIVKEAFLLSFFQKVLCTYVQKGLLERSNQDQRSDYSDRVRTIL